MSQKRTRRISQQANETKRKWIAISLAFSGALLVFLAFVALRDKPSLRATIEVTGAPSLKPDKEKIDLGDVKLGQLVQVSFQLSNVGDRTLRFTRDPYIVVAEGC